MQIFARNANLITFTEKILNGKLQFLCSDTLNLALELELDTLTLNFEHISHLFCCLQLNYY